MYAIVFHAHQKLDRVACRNLRRLLPAGTFFPSIRQILKFEGGQGPDGARLKRQHDDIQPWHFIDPFDMQDTELSDQLNMHYKGLVRALRDHDDVRAGFEAAWLAHALVDGLTPAHHYPYEAELARLRGGEDRHTRKGLIGRAYVKSNSIRESLLLSMKIVGPKGLLTTHAMFEAGAYAIIAPLRLTNATPSKAEIDRMCQVGVVTVFRDLAQEVAHLRLYDRFIKGGWTRSLHRDIREKLAPRMAKMITLAWYCAAHEANLHGVERLKHTVKKAVKR